MEAPPKRDRDTLGNGLLLTILLHVVCIPVIGLVAGLAQSWDNPDRLMSSISEGAMIAGLNFGWAQVLYVVPGLIVLQIKGLRKMRNGMLLLAGLGFLVTSGCWGLVAMSF